MLFRFTKHSCQVWVGTIQWMRSTLHNFTVVKVLRLRSNLMLQSVQEQYILHQTPAEKNVFKTKGENIKSYSKFIVFTYSLYL